MTTTNVFVVLVVSAPTQESDEYDPVQPLDRLEIFATQDAAMECALNLVGVAKDDASTAEADYDEDTDEYEFQHSSSFEVHANLTPSGSKVAQWQICDTFSWTWITIHRREVQS